MIDVIGGAHPATDHNAAPPTIAEFFGLMLDHMSEEADASNARGTIVEAEPWRRSKRTNTNMVTVFTISAISKGVKASAGLLVQAADKLSITSPYERHVIVQTLGCQPRTLVSHGGEWPR